MTIRIDCPLCDWHMDPEQPDLLPYNVPDMFGLGVMQQVAYMEYVQKTERELREHLGSHDLAEWVRKVAELQAKVAELTGNKA